MNMERASAMRLVEGGVSICPELSRRNGDVSECCNRLPANERVSSRPLTCSRRCVLESRKL